MTTYNLPRAGQCYIYTSTAGEEALISVQRTFWDEAAGRESLVFSRTLADRETHSSHTVVEKTWMSKYAGRVQLISQQDADAWLAKPKAVPPAPAPDRLGGIVEQFYLVSDALQTLTGEVTGAGAAIADLLFALQDQQARQHAELMEFLRTACPQEQSVDMSPSDKAQSQVSIIPPPLVHQPTRPDNPSP